MSNSNEPAACPVDHNSREAWLSQARAASSATKPESPARTRPPSHPPTTDSSQETCPVDHKARDVWIQQARASAAGSSTESPKPAPTQAQTQHAPASWTSSIFSRLPSLWSSSTPQVSKSTPSSHPQYHPQSPSSTTTTLDTSRVISTIPRSSPIPSTLDAAHGLPQRPANQEQETGADAASGNWIYPSQKMFFEAMKRKGHDPQDADMATVVPIHNAVNERAWAEIKEWEGPWVRGTSCDGPRLSSFSGLSTNLSPKARINSWLGYQAPFDRHDWVVDRCGREIEYIIDFYAGRPQGDGKLSFYLDVRPKLNSWEGVKMRALKGLGVV